jgi:hypothetical protein
MHFRVRKNVVQLIRVSYDASKKRGVNTVVGAVKLVRPDLSAELQALMSPEEVVEFQNWLTTRHRADTLRDELAALTLADSMADAERWFEREGASQAAWVAATSIVMQWQSLRRRMVKNGLLK